MDRRQRRGNRPDYVALSGKIPKKKLSLKKSAKKKDVFPCVSCEIPVLASEKGIQCDECHLWQHIKCNSGIAEAVYDEAVAGLSHNIFKNMLP